MTRYPILVSITTTRWRGKPGEESSKKRVHEFKLVSDTSYTGDTATVSWSDDDYQTFTHGLDVDLGSRKKHRHRCGYSYERAWRISYEGYAPSFRFEALELDYTPGTS